jgi:chromosomal replication initiator protein
MEQEFGKAHLFENFERRKGCEDSFDFAEAMATGTAEFYFLLIYGTTGNGKTHLLHAMAAALQKRGIGAYFVTCSEFMTDYWAAVKADRGAEFLQRSKGYTCLLLDDWKPDEATARQADRLEEILCARFDSRLLTVMTTNKTPKDLPERVTSRFADKRWGRTAHNQSSDYRIQTTRNLEAERVRRAAQEKAKQPKKPELL